MRSPPGLVLMLWLLIALALFVATRVSPSRNGPVAARLYDWAFFGLFPRQSYKSSDLRPPLLNYARRDRRCDSGFSVIGPRGTMVSTPGPVILDWQGELIWMEDQYGQAMDVKVQQYRGRDYLTFWIGSVTGTFGTGKYVMLDQSYQVYKTISATNDLDGDLHEFKITENGTALMTVYKGTTADLTAFGIASQGWIYDSIFQEIDIETGELLFEWRASEHYRIEDTFHTIEAEARRPDSSDRTDSAIGMESKSAWDFFHINSVDKDTQGNYYISSRYMHSITCISPSGEIVWILGGKQNQFTDLSNGAATNFKFQHHAGVHENNILTIFDNGKYDARSDNAEYSRGLLVRLDLANMTATVLQEYVHPDRVLVGSQGSVQLLPDSGHAVVGWGYVPAFTEFDTDGSVLCDVHIASSIVWNLGWVKNYRTFRTSSWVGKPSTQADVYLRPREGRLYVSWNGATEVDRWLLQGREIIDQAALYVDLASVKKEGFESSIEISSDMPLFVRLAALDKGGNVLGYSVELSRKIGNAPSELPQLMVLLVLMACLAYYLWRVRASIPGLAKARDILDGVGGRKLKAALAFPKRSSITKCEADDWAEECSVGESGRTDVEGGLAYTHEGGFGDEELQPLYHEEDM